MTVYTVIFTLYGYFRAEAGLVSAFLFVKFRFVELTDTRFARAVSSGGGRADFGFLSALRYRRCQDTIRLRNQSVR